MKFILYTLAFIYCTSLAIAQEKDSLSNLDSDELYSIGRNKIFNGKRDEGRLILFKALAKSPEYSEIELLIARSYAWDDQTDSARHHINQILEKEPKYLDALITSIDIENWSENYQSALVRCNKALKFYPNDSVLVLKKARVLTNLEQYDLAAQTLEIYTQKFPYTSEMRALYNSLKVQKIKNNFSLIYALDLFKTVFDPSHNLSIQYGRVTPWGSIIFRENYAQRFDTSGFQTEFDAYPSLFKNTYAYVNYGFSNRALFPKNRVGIEVYRSLPWTTEASLGLRFLDFTNSNTTIYTISAGKYYRSFWLSARTFLIPDKDLGLSNSYTIILRRYYENATHFLEFNGGLGFSPDYRLGFQGNAGIGNENIVNLKSDKIGISYQRNFGIRWSSNIGYTLRRQQFAFASSEYIFIHSFNIQLQHLF